MATNVVAKMWASLYLGLDRVVRSFRANTVPTVPVLAVTVVSSSSLSLSIATQSTVAGNSAIHGYKFYDGNDVAISANPIDITPFATLTLTGLLAATQYTYKARAITVEGVQSTLSAAVSATTQPAVQTPHTLTTSPIPDQTVNTGQPYATIDLKAFFTDSLGHPLTFAINSGQLPPTMSFNPSTGIISPTGPTSVDEVYNVQFIADDNYTSPAPIPDQVTGLGVPSYSATFVTLAWSNVLYESGYYIERSSNGGSTWSQVGSALADVTTFTDTTVSASTAYDYRVRAYSAAGNGPYSTSVHVVTSAASGADNWLERSTGSGVIWAHDFSDSREVDAFRINTGPSGYYYNRQYAGPPPPGDDGNGHYGDGNANWVADATLGKHVLQLTVPTPPAAIGVQSISNASTAVFTTTLNHNLTPGKLIFFTSLAGGSWSGLNEYYHGSSGIFGPIFVVLTTPTPTTFTCRGGGNNDRPNSFPGVTVDGTSMGTYTASSGTFKQDLSSDAGWWRPFSPLPAVSGTTGNGKTTPDPAANGTLTRRTGWDCASLNCNYNWKGGYFCHPDYAAAAAAVGDVLGWDFWLQFRVKLSAGRFDSANALHRGKLMFINLTGDTPLQEIVIWSNAKPWNYTDINQAGAVFTMYTHATTSWILQDPFAANAGGGFASYQPGSSYSATCAYPVTGPLTCWEWPQDEWVTVLMHIIPGHVASGAPNDSGDNGIQVWVARQSQLSNGYVKIHDKLNYGWTYGNSNGHPNGTYNAVNPSVYMNGLPAFGPGWNQSFAEIILSKNFIPCPTA